VSVIRGSTVITLKNSKSPGEDTISAELSTGMVINKNETKYIKTNKNVTNLEPDLVNRWTGIGRGSEFYVFRYPDKFKTCRKGTNKNKDYCR
jgi:hypothetical protein